MENINNGKEKGTRENVGDSIIKTYFALEHDLLTFRCHSAEPEELRTEGVRILERGRKREEEK